MQQSRTSLAGIEVGLTGVKVLLAGFSLFPSVLRKFLVAREIVEIGPQGETIPRGEWFPLPSWLLVHDDIDKNLGANVLYALGTHILTNPKFPDWIQDLPGAIQAVDIAYHRSHRKGGLVMYDDTTELMLEGIGHYRGVFTREASRIEVECDTPYLCEIDHGILSGITRRFSPKARVTHSDRGCRRKGARSCFFSVNP